jgi:hypothetical protein
VLGLVGGLVGAVVGEAVASVGNSNTAVIQPCIRGLNTDSLYSNTVYFLGIHTVTNTIQYGLTAVLPPCIKVGLLALLPPPCCCSVLGPIGGAMGGGGGDRGVRELLIIVVKRGYN